MKRTPILAAALTAALALFAGIVIYRAAFPSYYQECVNGLRLAGHHSGRRSLRAVRSQRTPEPLAGSLGPLGCLAPG